MKIVEINGLEDSVIERDATTKEIDAIKEIQVTVEAHKAEEATNAALRAEQKAGLLARLGITAEEAELLLG